MLSASCTLLKWVEFIRQYPLQSQLEEPTQGLARKSLNKLVVNPFMNVHKLLGAGQLENAQFTNGDLLPDEVDVYLNVCFVRR
jgi:hypothetical protein